MVGGEGEGWRRQHQQRHKRRVPVEGPGEPVVPPRGTAPSSRTVRGFERKSRSSPPGGSRRCHVLPAVEGSPGDGRGERDFFGVCRKAKASFADGAGSGVGWPVPRLSVPRESPEGAACSGLPGIGRGPRRPQPCEPPAPFGVAAGARRKGPRHPQTGCRRLSLLPWAAPAPAACSPRTASSPRGKGVLSAPLVAAPG